RHYGALAIVSRTPIDRGAAGGLSDPDSEPPDAQIAIWPAVREYCLGPPATSDNVGYFGALVVFGPCGGYAVVRSLPLVCFLFYGAIFIDFLSEYPWLSVIPIVTATTKLHLRITFTFFGRPARWTWPHDFTDPVRDVDSRRTNCCIRQFPWLINRQYRIRCLALTVSCVVFLVVAQQSWGCVDGRY
ncbi:hypothetical protein T02_11184, partial [Trichinella nativa]